MSDEDEEVPMPIYEGLVAELGDPHEVARGIDEWAIQWHADRMRAQAPEDPAG
jgi:hypothetical protein